MRTIFFNIWHGQVWDKLEGFILENKEKTNIFAFLEVNSSVQDHLKEILPEFKNFYYEGNMIDYLGGINQGMSVFYSENIICKEVIYTELFKPERLESGGLVVMDLEFENKKMSFGLVHGRATPGTKEDTPQRIDQSQKIIDIFKNKAAPKIIGGDFNLFPDTKSVRMFEEENYRNLINEFGIKSTRNKLSWEQFNNVQYFADYCFITKDVKVIDFKVPNIEASDHEPLILDFEI